MIPRVNGQWPYSLYFRLLLVSVLALGSPPAARASICNPGNNGITYADVADVAEIIGGADSCETQGCFLPFLSPFYELSDPACDPWAGPCSVKIGAEVVVRENHVRLAAGLSLTETFWFASLDPPSSCGVPPSCTPLEVCGAASGTEILHDAGRTWYQVTGFSCVNPEAVTPRNRSILTIACQNSSGTGCYGLNIPAKSATAVLPADPQSMFQALCREPRKDGCPSDECRNCTGPGRSVGVGGGGPGLDAPQAGPGAQLRYLARGVGSFRTPGATQWNDTLGRNWSHDHAERIVPDPDETHVWLLTKHANFREYSSLSSGVYQTVSPSSDKRELRHLPAGGWELEELDGAIHSFDTSGRWIATTERGGRYAITGEYDANGRLSRVVFPDGRAEEYTYYESAYAPLDGKLQSITELGTDGDDPDPDPDDERTWVYTWAGDDLQQIDRPDGTSYRFEYRDGRHPGYLTAWFLVAADDGVASKARPERVLGAWSYDEWGNAEQAWTGSTTFLSGVDQYSFVYDDGQAPTTTTVTIPIDTDVDEVVEYTYERDPDSGNIRMLAIAGECGACGGTPESHFEYESDQYFLPARIIDAFGTVTAFEYGLEGQVERRTDGANILTDPTLPRRTDWTYHVDYPGVVESRTGPYRVGETPTRFWDPSYDAFGDMSALRIQGVESTYSPPTGSFDLTTTYPEYNAVGKVVRQNPPGYGDLDEVHFDYMAPGTNAWLPSAKTAPVVGTSTYSYTTFNRLASVTDANGATTEYSYDSMDRISSITLVGDGGSLPDLTTDYVYDRFGDLFCVGLPKGNGVRHVRNAATGRLDQVQRGTLLAGAPTVTTCLEISSTKPAERIRYDYDLAGHVKHEYFERGTTSSFTTRDRERAYTYYDRCHLQMVTENPQDPAQDRAITEYAYDCNGNLEKVWDPLNPSNSQTATPSTEYDYDPINRLVASTAPWGGGSGGTVVTSYEYDPQDHLIAVTDGESNSTLYEYSDRDLMVAEDSLVSGFTEHTYNEHGALVQTRDARGIARDVLRDAADNSTQESFAGSPELTTIWSYGTDLTCLANGRLKSITKDGYSIAYCYDHYGRLTEDGDLEYGYDANGNRQVVIYHPHDLVATYTHDFADRPRSLSITSPGQPATVVVDDAPIAAGYRSSGPLRELVLGNGVRTVSRGHDYRYNPSSLTVSGSLLSWLYESDKVGNVTAIDTGSQDRTFAYQPYQYFLTGATGPWSPNPEWTYDRTGNRLFEWVPFGGTYYWYSQMQPSGNSALLEYTSLSGGGKDRAYSYDAAGHVTGIEADANSIEFRIDDASMLSTLTRVSEYETRQIYDGRGFLRRVEAGTAGKPPERMLDVCYSSEGRLRSLLESDDKGLAKRTSYLYFGEQPIAQWQQVNSGTPTILYYVTDHLGTPTIVLDTAGAIYWSGGFEPFGRDYQQGTSEDALAKGLYLRLPGQWDHPIWDDATLGADLYYNVYRWYERGVARYVSPDPQNHDVVRRGLITGIPVWNAYSYVDQNPLRRIDPLGRAWQDWFLIGPVQWIYCGIMDEKCFRDSQCCYKEGGFANKYGYSDEEEMLQKFYSSGRLIPEYDECFANVRSCQNLLEYCPDLALKRFKGVPARGLKGLKR